jgi:hypothetical protein
LILESSCSSEDVKERKRRVFWTDHLTVDLFAAAGDVEPYAAVSRRDKEEAWDQVASLVCAKNPECGVNRRNAKSRAAKMIKQVKKQARKQATSSGIAHPRTEVEDAVYSYITLTEVLVSHLMHFIFSLILVDLFQEHEDEDKKKRKSAKKQAQAAKAPVLQEGDQAIQAATTIPCDPDVQIIPSKTLVIPPTPSKRDSMESAMVAYVRAKTEALRAPARATTPQLQQPLTEQTGMQMLQALTSMLQTMQQMQQQQSRDSRS